MSRSGYFAILIFTFLFLLWGGPTGIVSSTWAEEVTYRSGALVLTGFLSKPDGKGPFPVVIYNHGGKGKAIGGAPLETSEALARAGFVGFSPIRRTEISFEGNLQDVLSAIDYVKRLEFVDPNRIGIIGFSRGGILALMTAIERSDLKAIVVMAAAPGRGQAEQVIRHIDKITAPVLLMVAENDLSPADHVRIIKEFKEALERAGKEVSLILYPPFGSDGHEMFFKLGDYWKDVLKFLKQRL